MAKSDDYIKKILGEDPKGKESNADQQSQKTAGSSVADDFIRKHNYDVDENYINTFLSDANRFMNTANDDYGKVGWGNASSSYQSRRKAWTDLDYRRSIVRGWLESNKDRLDANTYKNLAKSLDDIGTGGSDIVKAFSNAKNYYSQFETEDDYNSYLDTQEMLNLDLEQGSADIQEMENLLQEYREAYYGMSFAHDNFQDNKDKVSALETQYGKSMEKLMQELEQSISERKAYMNRAERLQDGVRLSSVSDPNSELYDPEFKAYAEKGAAVVNPEFEDVPGWLAIGSWNPFGEDPKNKVTFTRDNWDKYIQKSASGMASGGSTRPEVYHMNELYTYMTENEVSIYNYYFAKDMEDGTNIADDYLDSIEETLNDRKAEKIYEPLEGNVALEMVFGVAAGLDQFGSGIKNLFNTKDDYIAPSATQIASGMVREDLADVGPNLPDWLGGASLGQIGYDAATTTANMAPSIFTSMAIGMLNPVLGQAAGTALMGASAAGNAYQEALNLGYDKSQARAYSALVGASEAGLQYLLGGIGSLGGKVSNNALTKMLSGIDNAFARTALKVGGEMFSEGFEEGLQEVLTPLFKNWTLNMNEDVNWSEVAYSSLLGALTAGFMEGPSTISGEVGTYKTGKHLQAADISAARLAEIGKTFSADTVAYQLAGKVDENTSAYTMGRLFNEIGATLSEQNVSEITEALVTKGMDRETAAKNAEALAYVVEGGQLSESQIAIIEANDVLAEVTRTTLIDANTTWNQRSKGYNDALKALADEMAAPKASRTKQAKQSEETAPTADTVDTKQENGAEALSEAEKVDTSPAKVKSISSVKAGQVTIKLEDGTEVNVKEADLDPDDGVRIETIASIDGISSEDANFILNTLRTSTNASAQMDSLGAKEAYKYGFYGFSQDHIAKHGVFANSLSDTQRQAIYETGKKARQQQIEDTTLKTGTGKQTDIYFDSGNGNVVSFRDARKTLTEKQTAGVRTAMILRKLGIGGNIYFFESYRNSKGQLVYKDKNGNEVKAPNGWYDQDGSIHIDLNAGSKGQGFVLFTLAHELTHFIEQWSPQKYKALADFLIENYEKGQSMDKLVRAKQAKLSAMRGKQVPYSEAYSEVIADSMEAMLADGNVLEKLIELKAKDNALFTKMKQFFDNLLNKIRSIYKGQTPDSAEGRAVMEMTESIEKIQQLFAEAMVDASENYQSSLTPGEEGTVVNESGDPVAYSTEDGSVLLSMRTYEEDGRDAFRKYLQKCVKNKRLTKAEMQEMLDGIEDIYTTCKEFKDKYAPFSSWSDAAVVRDTYGKPVFSVVTPNGDYKMNLDFSLVCKKRRTLDAVFNEMSKRGIIDNFELGQKSVVKINEIIRKYGLETACALCFVDAKRFRQASMADSFTGLYNELVLSLVPEDQRNSIEHFNFSGYETIKKVENGIHTWDASKLDFSHLDEVMKNYGNGTVEYRTAKYLKAHPEGRKLLLRGDFMSSQGFDAVKAQNPDVLKLYNSKKGTGGPKAAFGDVQYMNEIIKKARTWTPAKAYEVGGVRIQSFSDYVPRMVFDYVQMVYDLAATKLPAHAYTKEALFVKQFGLTGIKINMSLIPAIAEGGIAPGLDANGNYVWAGESFDFETAKEIQKAEGYTENCGTICVGVSRKHIEKLLSDPDIRMVIPYHKSGLNPVVAHMNKIAEFEDYTNKQNTIDRKTGSKAEEHFDFNKALHDMGKNADPKAVIQQYFDWCDERDYDPKFAEFRYHPNYYKLIEDFTLYDTNGQYVPQREVRAVFPKEGSAFGSMKDLIKAGLEEDAVIEGKRDSSLSSIVDEIQKTLPRTEAEIAEDQVAQADRDLEAEVKYSIREAFYKEFDAWDKKDTNRTFVVGTTSDALQSVGMKDQNIVLRSGTVLQKIKDHPEMTFDIFKGIPELLEHPVIVQFSDAIDPKTKRPKYDSSITVLGELYADVIEDGKKVKKPVLVSLELSPTNKKKTAVLNFAIIKSAYSKNALQQYLNENSILYIDPDKERTDSWLSLNRLQLPLGENRYGPIRKIAYVDGKVKVQNPKHMTEMQKKLFEAGLIDEFGNKLFSDRGYGGIREVLAKKGLDELSKRYGSHFPLSASFDATMRADNTPLVMATVKANQVKRKTKESPFKTGKQAFRAAYGVQTTVHIKQMGIDAELFSNVASESIAKAKGLANEQSTLDVIPNIRDILSNSILMGVERIVHTDGKGTALYGYRLYNLYLYDDGKTKTPHCLACTVVQNLDKAEGYVFQNIENVTVDQGLPGNKAGMPSSVNGNTYTVAQLYRTVKKIDRFDGGLKYTDEERDKYLFSYTERNDGVKYSDRDTESVSNRSLLANAFEGVVQNEIEKEKIQEYKDKIDLINTEERKLSELNEQIKELSFSKGSRDTKKIRELQLEARQTANRINTYDKQLLRLEASKPLQDVLTREKKKAYKRAEQKGKEALAAYKERAAENQRELLNRWQESRKKGVEDRKKSYVKEKIKGFKKRLETMLQRPTDRQYVPINLINAMVDVCELINTDTNLYKADGSINKAQERRNLTKEKLQSLKDEYEKLKTHSDPIYAGEFDEMVYAYLTELRDKYSGKHLNDMSLDELNEMYEILVAIDETLRDARKLIGWGDAEGVYEAGDSIIAEQNEITNSRKKGKRNAAQKARDTSLNYTLSPVRNVERMSGYNKDSYLLKLFKKFEQGIRKKNKFVMDAYKSFENLTSGKEYDDAIYKEVGGKKYTDIKGRKFGLSKMQMMQAILSYEREQANGLHHIESGGFSFADMDMLSKGKLKEAVSAEYSHRVPVAVPMVAEFQEVLKNDKWCQDYMAAARRFFDGMAKDAVNETSIILKHRIIAKDKNYIPFEVDTNFVNMEITDMDAVQKTINGYGMLKETKDKAPQAIYITGLNNILDRHIDQVGNIYGLAIEVRNFNKVWNVRSLDESGNDPTVKEAIDTNWGKEGVKHIEQTVKDIQGPRIRERSVVYDKVKSGYIGATFLLNLSVVTKQIGSLFSATSMLRWRGPVRQVANLLYTMVKHKKISAEVDKYTATAWMRRQGLSDAELHTLMTEGRKTWLGRLIAKAPAIINPTKWISAMDHAVALSLWRYAKIDTAKKTGLKGEALLKATAEFYDEVIENTQSMTDVLHRPEVQKRGDIISESLGMFKTDLYQMAGQLQTTTGRFMANKSKENGKALGRTLYAVAASAVWGQLMTTVFALLRYKVNQYRDEEDEELTPESWLKRQGFAFSGDLVGYIFPLFGSEFVSVIENIMYGESDDIVDSLVFTEINDLYDTMITVGASIKEGEMPEPAAMEKLTAKVLQVFGLPTNNILRARDAIRLHAKDIANGEFLSFEAGVDRSPKHHIHRITEAIEKGNLDVAKGLYEEALEELATKKADGGEYGEDELKEAISSLKTALGTKYTDGEVSEDTVRKILSKVFGMEEDDIYWTFDKWNYSKENGSSDDYAKYSEFFTAVETGKNLKAVIKEYTDNGVSTDTLVSQITSHFKPLYAEMSKSERASIKGYLLNAYEMCGMSRVDAEEKIAKWQFEADHPELVDRISYTQYKRWEADGKPNGVSIELFTDVAEFRDDGTSASAKSQEEVAAYINSLSISIKQKDALWCCFWKESTLKNAPWH